MSAKLLMDLEGIAFDPLPFTIKAVRRSLARLGRPVSADTDLSFIAKQPIQATLDTLLPGEERLHHRFLNLLRHHYCQQRWHTARLTPDIRELLAGLGSGFRVQRVIVSANPRATVACQLTDLGLVDRVDHVLYPEGSGCAHCRRRLVAQQAQAADDSTLVWLTDLPSELEAAREISVLGVGALWGRLSEQQLRETGDHAAESPRALLASWSHVTVGSLNSATPAGPR